MISGWILGAVLGFLLLKILPRILMYWRGLGPGNFDRHLAAAVPENVLPSDVGLLHLLAVVFC